MLCMLWVLLQSLVYLAEGGSSGSAEAVAAEAMNMNVAMAANNPNPAAGNGPPILLQILPAGGSFLIQPTGPLNGQAPLSIVPVGNLQQSGGIFIGQAGDANGVLQPQGQLLQPTNGGQAPFLLVLPQGNNMGGPLVGPLNPMMTPGPMQILSGQNIQLPGAAGNALLRQNKARVKRSVAVHPTRRAQRPVTTVLNGEDEESSGTEIEDNTAERLE